MGRKTAVLGLRLGAGLMLAAMFVAANFVSTPAAAQGNCPPGQVFVPVENKSTTVWWRMQYRRASAKTASIIWYMPTALEAG